MFLWIFGFLIGLCYGVSTQCTSSGRYPNDIVEDCRGYTTCIAIGSNFYQYDLACPTNFIYNHFDNQCTNATGYHCYPQFNCTEVGAYPDPASTNCSSYVACIQALSAINARLIDCPMNTVFDPIQESCVADALYTCPTSTEKPIDPVDTGFIQPNVTIPSHNTNNISGNGASCIGVRYIVVIFMFGLQLF